MASKANLRFNPLVVIKIGSSSIIDSTTGDINYGGLSALTQVVCRIRTQGWLVVLVSSGAVGVGCLRVGLGSVPHTLTPSSKRALAALGQARLMAVYDELFGQVGILHSQVLLAPADLRGANQANICEMLNALLSTGAVPILNENDATKGAENFGDNDNLAVTVAAAMGARFVMLMTDVDALYSKNPKVYPNAEPLRIIDFAANPNTLDNVGLDIAASTPSWGTGGMEAKVAAARRAVESGCSVAIISAQEPSAIPRILSGERTVGTVFPASSLARPLLIGGFPGAPENRPLKKPRTATPWASPTSSRNATSSGHHKSPSRYLHDFRR